ncbi:TRAP transporter, DctM subunit [Evansella caseinilytica]|uniref:TRAP transporter, DctM subunit n=1 Tax=Evansella caseinilytica TaxID=1503961 RepID=A0A1H3HU21_9BACI|nr:TRAP transporter large permease subunit [Evansella caseinilytica]SDY18997.1 TRAP transporter, DctM subunit [Evansella caseinilytica]
MTLVVFLVSLIIAVMIGMPIAFSLLFSGVAIMIYLNGFNSMILSMNLFAGADSFALMAIPFFILAGEFMNRGGITQRIVNFANALVGHIKGGLAYVSILAILLFAAMIGSAVASAAALGGILIPMMVRANYKRDKVTGLIAAGNILSPIMPPSVPLIIFGVQAGVSITSLFIAGIVPAIYLTVILCATWFIVSRKDNLQTNERQSVTQVLKALLDGLWAILLPVFILLGLRSGMFTPTEAGVIAAVYALVVGVVVYRELKIRDLLDCLVTAAKASSVIMFLAAAATVSSWLLTVGNVPQIMTSVLEPFIDQPVILMLIIAVLVVLIGMALDVTPIIMILTPVLLPVVTAAGIDPIYFGVTFVLMCMIGLLTPPVGNVLNVTSKAGNISMERMVKAVWPFLLAEIILIVLIILFPALIEVPLRLLVGN